MVMKTIPHKQKAQIQGAALEYVMSGSGAPPIFLVNGEGGPVDGWYRVHPLDTVGIFLRTLIVGCEPTIWVN